VWLYFDKIPPHALGYNVCKKCNKKFSITTGVTTLRGHLKTHQLKAPTKKQTVSTKHKNPFDEDEQTNTMNTLFSGLFVISNNSQSSITIILESF
jgi:BED zinc finger